MTSTNEKKRRRPLSSPGMVTVLETLTVLASKFPEVDYSKLHSGYACRACDERLKTVNSNLQSALPILPKLVSAQVSAQVASEAETTHARTASSGVSSDSEHLSSQGKSPPLTVSYLVYDNLG